jgi:tRNA(fMet)-specific endonuclease VapC
LKYLIDTDWLVDAYIGRPGPVYVLEELRSQGLGVSIISHGELFEGTFGFPDAAERLNRVYALLSRFETLPLTDPIMEIFGHTRSHLRRSGQMIADLDLLIAATAVSYDLTLLTRNVRHFRRVPNLQIHAST